jgi:two-component system response regulator
MDRMTPYYESSLGRKQRDALLLIEDSADLAALIKVAVEKSAVDAEVVVARDGLEALDVLFGDGVFAKKNNALLPCLILLDLNLPKFRGDQVLQVLKSEARTQGIPTVVLSGSDYEIDELDSLGLGAMAFVRKPIRNYLSTMIMIIEAYWPSPEDDEDDARP